jgi:hypothetical protein
VDIASFIYIIEETVLEFNFLTANYNFVGNAIDPDKFDKLITSLRTAVDNDGVLDKE